MDKQEKQESALASAVQSLANAAKSIAKSFETAYLGSMPVKLVDGGAPWKGRLEVFYYGRWTTVQDHDFDNRDAQVVCRQLGYEGGEGDFGFPAGDKPILIKELNCGG